MIGGSDSELDTLKDSTVNFSKDFRLITPAPLWPQHPDEHYGHLAATLPAWLLKASAARRATLADMQPSAISQFGHVTSAQHRTLKQLNSAYWHAQNTIDQRLQRLQNAREFGAPLLRAALKQQFGLDLDVNTTWLRLYIPTTTPWFPIKSGGARTWTVSLLDAALHNFEPDEAKDDAYAAESAYITEPSATGQFEVLRNIKHRLGIGDFARLCRELDLGKQYQAWLEDNLGISNGLVRAVLQPQISDSHKSALRLALELALIAQEPMNKATYRSLLGLIEGGQNPMLNGQPLLCHDLTMMNARLTGILLFAPDLEHHRNAVSVIAYIPDDPEQPLKEYPSSAEFMADLSKRLRSKNYQAFFSRFVAHADRGYFFADLNNRLTQTTWHQRERGDPLPSWRETPAAHSNLQFAATPIRGNLWNHLQQRKLDKILNDARTLAVSTANADRQARWERWDSFTGIASAVLQIAAFVALPFVPFLGELMLAYTAYQVLDETFEGVIDWAEGLTQQAFAHTMGVVETLVQLGTFAAGGSIAVGAFRQVLPHTWIDFIDRFTPVKSAGGQTRYWDGNMKPYQQSETATQLSPGDLGLREHHEKNLLILEDNTYSVTKTNGRGPFEIEHPTRPEAYKPRLKHNGNGAWQIEHEQPLSWTREKLLMRLGHVADSLSLAEREQALSISGYHENTLRRIHVDHEPLPALLADTLKRLKIDKDLRTFIERLGSAHADLYLSADAPTQLQLLTEDMPWPSHKALRLLDSNGQVSWQSDLSGHHGARVYDVAELNGDVLKASLGCLNEAEIKALFDEPFGDPQLAVEVRTGQFRARLTQIAQSRRNTLFESRYRAQQISADPLAQHLIDAVPGLPAGSAQELVLSASARELQQLEQGVVAPRLKELARWTQQQVRAVRAREGLELDSVDNPDAERLAVHSLSRLPGWSGNVRIEIKRYSFEGETIDSTGPLTSPRKVLVQLEDGRYQPYDNAGAQLASSDDFYSSLLSALPDSERENLNLHIGQGPLLKQSIREHALTHEELQALLSSTPVRKPSYNPNVMRLPGGSDGYRLAHPGAPSLQKRIQVLYPSFTEEELAVFTHRLQQHPSGARVELSRLHAEFIRLSSDLDIWANAEVNVHPLTGADLSPAQIAANRNNRQLLNSELQRCWRRQTALDEATAQAPDPDYLFSFIHPIIGELPAFEADFSHITHVVLEGNEMTLGGEAFLNHFTGMRRLAVRDIALPNLPEVIATRPDMTQLIISNCRLRLSAETQAVIAALSKMRTLDLYRNPLGISFSVEGMPALEYLDLNDCQLTSVPAGLATRTVLRGAILSDNAISELPVELFDLPPERVNRFDFGDNPFSDATRNRIKANFQRIRQDFGVVAPQADLERAVNLYPLQGREEASDFVYRLPGTLETGRIELTRLETEYSTMVNALAAWTADVPALHPVTQQPFTPLQLLLEHSTRDNFKREIEKAWRKDLELDQFNNPLDPSEPSYELDIEMIIIGDLPTLTADFSHVSHLYLGSEEGLTTVGDGFLRCFPKLKTLTIRDYRIATIPDSVFNMGRLQTLELSDCHITLTPNTVAELAGMENMDILDLSGNPLTLAPDVSQMPNLSMLILNDTLITELPHGLLQLQALDEANLSNNEIRDLPSDLLELPRDAGTAINLRDNPFSEESLQLLHAYFKKTRIDFGVEAIIDSAEMEVSDSEDSTMED